MLYVTGTNNRTMNDQFSNQYNAMPWDGLNKDRWKLSYERYTMICIIKSLERWRKNIKPQKGKRRPSFFINLRENPEKKGQAKCYG